MPTIKLTDQVGLSIDLDFADSSAVAKYFKKLPALSTPNLNLAALENIPLDEVPVSSLNTGLKFEQPVELGADQVEMKVSAGISGSISLFTPKDEQLFNPELFGDPITIGPDQRYLSLAVAASLATVIQQGDPDEYRRLPAAADALWEEMKKQ